MQDKKIFITKMMNETKIYNSQKITKLFEADANILIDELEYNP